MSSSLHNDLGRVRRVKAKPLRRRFASPDTASTAKRRDSYKENGQDQNDAVKRVRAANEDVGSVPAGFLFNGALSTYEKLGFICDRKIGKHRWVVTRVVEPRWW